MTNILNSSLYWLPKKKTKCSFLTCVTVIGFMYGYTFYFILPLLLKSNFYVSLKYCFLDGYAPFLTHPNSSACATCEPNSDEHKQTRSCVWYEPSADQSSCRRVSSDSTSEKCGNQSLDTPCPSNSE